MRRITCLAGLDLSSAACPASGASTCSLSTEIDKVEKAASVDIEMIRGPERDQTPEKEVQVTFQASFER